MQTSNSIVDESIVASNFGENNKSIQEALPDEMIQTIVEFLDTDSKKQMRITNTFFQLMVQRSPSFGVFISGGETDDEEASITKLLETVKSLHCDIEYNGEYHSGMIRVLQNSQDSALKCFSISHVCVSGVPSYFRGLLSNIHTLEINHYCCKSLEFMNYLPNVHTAKIRHCSNLDLSDLCPPKLKNLELKSHHRSRHDVPDCRGLSYLDSLTLKEYSSINYGASSFSLDEFLPKQVKHLKIKVYIVWEGNVRSISVTTSLFKNLKSLILNGSNYPIQTINQSVPLVIAK